MGRKNESKIPYPVGSPQYGKYWRLTKKEGKTHDEALEILKTWIPRGKNGWTRVIVREEPERTPEPQETKEPVPSLPSTPPSPPELPEPPLPAQSALEKKVDRIVTLMAEMTRVLNRIADSMDPKPGATGTVTLQSRPATAGTPQSVRATENGFFVGDKVKRTTTGEVGQITRVMPGRKEAEVKFMLGTRTLPVDQLVEVTA